MDYFTVTGKNYKLSRFAVGTVQLGKTYGIDTLGKPSKKESISILKFALENGINIFDTAPSYGESEQILGEFMNDFGKESTYIVTKLDSQCFSEKIWEDKNGFSNKVREEFDLSCKKLGLDKIPIYLIHNARDAFRDNNLLINELSAFKNEGKIDFIGVSLYTGDELKKCMEDKRVDVVQIPFNVLDRRLVKSGLLEKAKERNLIVFARSTYLQGLLLMKPERIPKHLFEIVKYIKELREIAKSVNRSMKELCIKYVLSVGGISSVVVGINSLKQLEENIKTFNSMPLGKDVIEAIDEMPIPPDYILDPRMWSMLKSKN